MQMLRARATPPRRFSGLHVEHPAARRILDRLPTTAATVTDYIAQLQGTETPRAGLWIVGPRGAGKTTVACLILQAAIDHGHHVTLVDATALRMQRHGRNLAASDLLVIDDIDDVTGAAVAALVDVLQERYATRRPVVATASISRDTFGRRIGLRSAAATAITGSAVAL